MMRAGGSSTGAAYATAGDVAALANRIQRTAWLITYPAPLTCDLSRTLDSKRVARHVGFPWVIISSALDPALSPWVRYKSTRRVSRFSRNEASIVMCRG